MEERIVSGVFASANVGGLSRHSSPLAKLIEEAMGAAIQKAYDEGAISDDEIKKQMAAAREDVKQKYAAAVEEALRKSNLAG